MLSVQRADKVRSAEELVAIASKSQIATGKYIGKGVCAACKFGASGRAREAKPVFGKCGIWAAYSVSRRSNTRTVALTPSDALCSSCVAGARRGEAAVGQPRGAGLRTHTRSASGTSGNGSLPGCVIDGPGNQGLRTDRRNTDGR